MNGSIADFDHDMEQKTTPTIWECQTEFEKIVRLRLAIHTQLKHITLVSSFLGKNKWLKAFLISSSIRKLFQFCVLNILQCIYISKYPYNFLFRLFWNISTYLIVPKIIFNTLLSEHISRHILEVKFFKSQTFFLLLFLNLL